MPARSSPSPRPIKWHPPATAPKTGQILADFGWPWPVLAVWSPMSENWSTMMLNVSPDSSATTGDAWFEAEHEPPENLCAWAPMPELPRRPKPDALP